MKKHVTLNRLWIALSTILVIALIFTYYFLIYVPDKEKTVVAKKYRSLSRIGTNFITMKNDYDKSVKQQIWDHPVNRKTCPQTDSINRLQQKRSEVYHRLNRFIDDENRVPPGEDQLKTLDQQIARLRKREEDCEKGLSAEVNDVLKRLGMGSIHSSLEGNRFNERIASPDTLYFFSDHQSTSLSLSDFVSRQTLLNHFDRFVVVRRFDRRKNNAAQALVPASAQNKTVRDSVYSFIAYQGRDQKDNKILLGDLQAIFEQSHGLQSIPMRTVNISGIPYRLFAHIVQMKYDEDWLLFGLVNEAEIKKETRKVELIVLVFLVLGALFLLLSMPALKLLLVTNPIERLRISNVWFLGFSIVIGTSVASIIILVGHNYFNYAEDYEKKLEKLSLKVEEHFKLEVLDITRQLNQQVASVTSTEYKLKHDSSAIANTLKDTSTYDDPYPFYNETIFMNERGDALFFFATHPLPARTTRPNLKGRDYFDNAIQRKLYPFSTTDGVPPFTIQSILSWNSRAHEAGISISYHNNPGVPTKGVQRSDSLKVLAMATKLRSVMDPLLAPGYAFCIIDNNGEVLFHSEKDKNLQENFLDESEGNKRIQAAIEGRLQTSLGIEYGGRKTLTHIRPIAEQPMYIVTLYDEEYYNIPIVFTLSLALILVSMLFAIQGIQVAILFVTLYRPTKLKTKQFFLSWLTPRIEGGNRKIPGERKIRAFPELTISYPERYLRATAAMLFLAVLLIVVTFINYNVTRPLVIFILTLPVILLTLFFTILHDEPKEVRRFMRMSGLLLAIIDVIASPFVGFWIAFVILLQVATIAIFYWVIWVLPAIQLPLKIRKHTSEATAYFSFIWTWVFMVSMLSTYFIYKGAHKHESMIWERFIQLQTVNAIEQRRTNLLTEFDKLVEFVPKTRVEPGQPVVRAATHPELDQPVDSVAKAQSKLDSLRRRFMRASDQYGHYIDLNLQSAKKQNRLTRDTFVETAEFHLRPDYDGPLEKSRIALLSNMHGQPWIWFFENNLLTLTKQNTEITTATPSFSFLKGRYQLWIVISIALLSAIVYKLIASSTKYIFGTGLLPREKIPFSKTVAQIVSAIKNPRRKCRQLIVGLPFSGKTRIIRAVEKQLKNLTHGNSRGKRLEVKRYDFRSTPNLLLDNAESNTLWLIKHFEYGINDDEMNERRLRLIQHVEKQRNAKVIISTAIEPCLIMEVYERKIERLKEQHETTENEPSRRKDLASVRASYRKWKNLLAGFEVKHVSLYSEPHGNLKDSELSFGTYLPTLKERFFPKKENEDDFLLDVEEASFTYYHALWNSLSKNEKRILFDLAKDSFINLRDINPIRLLIKKGLIVMEDAPRIMNKSFANFILTVVDVDEEMAMNAELKQKGTWQSVQLILVITLIGVIVFVALVQNEMLSNLNAIIATISGIIALLLRFSGFFVGGKNKEG